MSRRFIIIHSLWLPGTIAIIAFLLEWTSDAFGVSAENFEKPYRGPFRIVFTATATVLLFGTQAMVARRFPL